MRKPQHRTLRTFDDIVFESKMLPTDDTFDIVPKNELEAFFINCAGKHGVIDQMFDPDFDGYDDSDFSDF